MITIKKLAGGGDAAVKEMLEVAAMLGIDVIELLWVPRNRLPYMYTMEVVGYKFPIIDKNTNLFNDDVSPSSWIDGTLKFYPDTSGRCWGYVYDIDENRDLVASSLVNGWFKIVDKRIRDEIIEYAQSKGYKTEPATAINILTKKSQGEKETESKIANLKKALEDAKERSALLEEELAKSKGDKATHINRRLRGMKKPQKAEIK